MTNETTTRDYASLNVYGDELTVMWDGNVWVAGNGAQFASKREAMKAEVVAHLRACGEDTTEIQSLLDDIN